MGGTRTVALELDGVRIDGDEVLASLDAAAWRANDAVRTADTTPASTGLLRRIVVALAELGERRGRPEALDLAATAGPRAAQLCREASALTFDVPAEQHVDDRIALRAEITALAVRLAGALVAARSGSALLLGSPEQRWAREAGFHLVQAQTADVRVAQVRAFG